MNNKLKIFQKLMIPFIAINLFASCVKQGAPEEITTQATGTPEVQGTSNNSNNNNDNPGDIVSIIDSELNFSSEDPKVGIKNFEQIVATYEAVTGTSRNDNDIRGPIRDVLKPALPMENKIIQFSAANQSAIVKTAYLFCRESTDSYQDVVAIWPTDLATGQAAAGGPFLGYQPDNHVNQFSNVTIKNYFINQSITKFYGMKFLSEAEKNVIRNELSEFIEELRVGYLPNTGQAQENRNDNLIIARAVCTTMLSSLYLTHL
jgi:hypothetical protein